MLNRHNLEIASLCSKEQSRYSLGGILVQPRRTAVTDGHLLMIVDTEAQVTSDNFPLTPGCTASDEFTPFILPAKSALDIARAIPKRSTIPVMMMAAVGSESDSNGHAVMAVNDLESPKVFTPKKSEGTFPEVDKCVPDIGTETVSFSLDLHLLIPLLKEMEKLADTKSAAVATFRVKDNNSPIRIDVRNGTTEQNGIAVIMPCKA